MLDGQQHQTSENRERSGTPVARGILDIMAERLYVRRFPSVTTAAGDAPEENRTSHARTKKTKRGKPSHR